MTDVLQKKINFPVKIKLILILSISIFTVVAAILTLTTRMVIKDKEAFLYENVYSNSNQNKKMLQVYFDDRYKYSDSIVDILLTNDLLIPKDRLNKAGDELFEILRVEARNGDLERVIYQRGSLKEKYRDNIGALAGIRDNLEEFVPLAIAEKKVFRLVLKENIAPHFIFARYDKKTSKVFFFIYLIDDVFDNYMLDKGFIQTILTESGKFIYNNKPFVLDDKTLIELQQKMKEKKSGFSEVEIFDEKYMLGVEFLDDLGGLYFSTIIKKRDAYFVTRQLIYQSILFAFILIGIFNMISIFLSNKFTNPLSKLLGAIEEVGKGNYSGKVIIQTKDELKLIGDAFNDMCFKIQEYNKKLEEYNRELENKVNERTADLKKANVFIKTMIDSLGQGLFVVNQDLSCADLYTKKCEEIFGAIPKESQVADLLKVDDASSFNSWLENLFQEMIPFKSLVELGPKEIIKSDPERHIRLEYHCIRDAEEKVSNVVIVGTDDTKEFLSKKKLKEQEELVKIITSVLEKKDLFLSFYSSFLSSIDSERKKKGSKEFRVDALRLLHSLKGSAGLFSMQNFSEFIHHEETLLSGQEDDEMFIESLNRVEVKLKEQYKTLENYLGSQFAVKDSSNSKDLRMLILNSDNEELIQKMKNLENSSKVSDLILNYESYVINLAQKLNKKIDSFKIEGGDVLVNTEKYKQFFASLVHLFRNSVDHGIEVPIVRQSKGKSQAGKISIDAKVINGQFKLKISDDGQGISTDRIKNKMKSLNYDPKDLEDDENKILLRIFDSEFSTAEQITEISGRGVGLYDVKKIVEELKGEIKVETQIDKGTCFSFIFPEKE